MRNSYVLGGPFLPLTRDDYETESKHQDEYHLHTHPRIHAHRTTGGNCDHCATDRDFAARLGIRTSISQGYALQIESQAALNCHNGICK